MYTRALQGLPMRKTSAKSGEASALRLTPHPKHGSHRTPVQQLDQVRSVAEMAVLDHDLVGEHGRGAALVREVVVH